MTFRSGFLWPAVLFGLMASAVPGHATAFCAVLPTSDGFVALRDAPSASARRLWRLKPGDMVQIDRTRPAKKGWAAVIYRSKDQKIQHTGWVSDRLIEKECG